MTAAARRASIQRPSISPLSTTSNKHLSSPQLLRADAMNDMDPPDEPDVDTPDGQLEEDDDGSSILSEPEEDDNVDAEQQNGLEDETMDGDDELAARRSLEVDSEAETERLDQTPQKVRKHADSLGRTPSKLSQAATAEDDLSDPPSPLPAGAGAASSTSTVATTGHKRKRSDTIDSSLSSAESGTDESPRKRPHESHEDAVVEEQDTAEVADAGDETPVLEQDAPKPVRGRKGKKKDKRLIEIAQEASPEGADQTDEPVETQEEPAEEDPIKTAEQLQLKKEASAMYDDVMKHFSSFSKKLYTERLASISAELELLTSSDPENCLHPEYLRQAACVDARLQKQLSESRAYYNYKLRAIRERTLAERSQLHSQYFQQMRDVREDTLYKLGEEWYAIQRDRRQSQMLDKDDQYVYKFQEKKSMQIKQQAKYNREVSILSGMARYVGFPAAPEIKGTEERPGALEEDLKGMQISTAVPAAAPSLLPNPIHTPNALPQPSTTAIPSAQNARPLNAATTYLPGGPATANFSQNERLAHEQFLEQTPWARAPQNHHHFSPANYSAGNMPAAYYSSGGEQLYRHTDDWAAEPGTSLHASGPGMTSGVGRHVMRNLSGQGRNGNSPYGTPLPQRQQFDSAVERSDGVEIPSSVQVAPPTERRVEYAEQNGASSPLMGMYNKWRAVNGNTAPQDGGGYRNISGTSTIEMPEHSHPAAEERRTEEDKEERKTDLQDEHRQHNARLPSLDQTTIQRQQPFATSQLHSQRLYRNSDGVIDVYDPQGNNQHQDGYTAQPDDRPSYPMPHHYGAQEGAYGTPAPLAAAGAAFAAPPPAASASSAS